MARMPFGRNIACAVVLVSVFHISIVNSFQVSTIGLRLKPWARTSFGLANAVPSVQVARRSVTQNQWKAQDRIEFFLVHLLPVSEVTNAA
jgi:hypothetical protein